MVLGATGILCLFAPLGATGPRFSSSESSKHEGVKYSCDECEYQAGFQSDLKTLLVF